MAVSDLFAKTGSFFKWQEATRADEQLEEQAAAAANERDVYAAVTKREEHRCRVCGAWCNPQATGLLEKGHHHHVVYRSAGGPTTLENICLLCAKCHNDEHQHRISIEGNAHAAPWLTLLMKDVQGQWYVWRQEIALRVYERD